MVGAIAPKWPDGTPAIRLITCRKAVTWGPSKGASLGTKGKAGPKGQTDRKEGT